MACAKLGASAASTPLAIGCSALPGRPPQRRGRPARSIVPHIPQMSNCSKVERRTSCARVLRAAAIPRRASVRPQSRCPAVPVPAPTTAAGCNAPSPAAQLSVRATSADRPSRSGRPLRTIVENTTAVALVTAAGMGRYDKRTLPYGEYLPRARSCRRSPVALAPASDTITAPSALDCLANAGQVGLRSLRDHLLGRVVDRANRPYFPSSLDLLVRSRGPRTPRASSLAPPRKAPVTARPRPGSAPWSMPAATFSRPCRGAPRG